MQEQFFVTTYGANGYVMDESGALILARDCQYPCLTCGVDPASCLSCLQGDFSYLYGSKCVEACPNGFYEAGLSFSCEPCEE